MKLSAAIEDALITGKYNKYDEFMCNVLYHQYNEELRDQLQALLNKVFPGIRNNPLVTVVYDNECGKPGFDSNTFWDSVFQYTSQFYVWLVFDLKRKGL